MKILKNLKNYHTIKKSNLFDLKWFKNNYDLTDDANPIKYYLKYGIEKNLNPSKDFDTLWYLNENVDVKNSGMHPFVHYIQHGIQEHRLSKPLFKNNNDKFSLINQDYNPCFLNKNLETINENDVNIAVFIKNDIENLLPTEYIRLVIPLYHLFLEKNFKPYIFSHDNFQEENFRNIDVIIVQRDALDENNAKVLVNLCRINKIKLIYEIDDDLLGIDKNHPNYNEFTDKKEAIKYLIENSDIVTVSTNSLKEKLHHLNYNIKVIKNSLNDMLNLKNNSFKSDVIKIGYMGTLTHKNDIKIIENAIDNVKKYFSKKGKKIIFETVGVSDENIQCANSIHIPVKYSKYPYFIRWLKRIIDWDIALAPLENTEINASKSEVKYLEYSSLNIPGIYSDIGAYSDSIENYKNGILIENNSSSEWESAIINLIEDTELQKDIVKNAQEDLKYNYSLDLMIASWIDLFKNILPNEKFQIFNCNPPLKLLTNPFFKKDYDIIVESNLFNEMEYPVVNQDPIYHFLNKGVFEGLNPYDEFNTVKYIKNNYIDITKINPLVHFIKKFNDKFKYNYLSEDNIEDILLNFEKKVSIIIPIYNAYEDTKKCIESVLKYSSKKFELILINDKSTDKRINKLLNYYETYPNIKIFNNYSNLGFVTSINIGLKNTNHDVILLNSDTIVTPKWLQKLIIAAYSDKRIATVTPLSNNAGVFSVLEGDAKNFLIKKFGINGISNIIEKSSNHVYLEVPTGNGFCMFIKRESIDSVGYFDEKTFGKGYGEENDFCMRCIDNGWINIIDDSTYIFHHGSSSFGNEKQKLIENNIILVEKKHPTYLNKVNTFVNSVEYKEIKNNAENFLNEKSISKKRILYVTDKKNIDKGITDNFVLQINNKLKLYYISDYSLFKIKEWSGKSAYEISFNIIVNLAIDDVIIDIKNLNLERIKKLINS